MRGALSRRALTACAAASALFLAGCTADPPPPIESTDSPNSPTAVPTKNTVVVAIDDIGNGFNPHLLADQSPTNSAVASLVLPSPFRPTRTADGKGTDWLLDRTVMDSADVTTPDPLTIVYKIRDEAQWSDGAPIAAEDFRYLWQQMIKEPGAVDPAGYRLIKDVGSSGGGKTVTVTMTAPYPAWRELFSNLLPSHLIKDSPGGFEQGMAENIPVSGGHFHIKQIDRGRDEILLERNDRYWDAPAKPDQILLRRAGTSAQLADSIRSGDAQVAVVHGGDAAAAQLAAIPSVRTAKQFQPRVLQLTLNARATALADVRVRSGVLALIDPELLAAVGSGSGSAVEPARAQVLSPSDPGYVPTAPERLKSDQAYARLAEAGYVRTATTTTVAPPTTSGPAPTATPNPMPGALMKDGKPLAIRIGTAEEDETAGAVASTVVDQLRVAGIEASVVKLAPEELYGTALVDRQIDAIVGWVRAGSDRATALASRFSCPLTPTVTTGGPTTPPLDGNIDATAPSNLSGVCDPSLQATIDAALRGTTDFTQVLAQAEPKLWELSAVLPVLQDLTIDAAAGDEVEGVSLDGAIQSGVFGDAAGWTRKPR